MLNVLGQPAVGPVRVGNLFASHYSICTENNPQPGPFCYVRLVLTGGFFWTRVEMRCLTRCSLTAAENSFRLTSFRPTRNRGDLEVAGENFDFMGFRFSREGERKGGAG